MMAKCLLWDKHQEEAEATSLLHFKECIDSLSKQYDQSEVNNIAINQKITSTDVSVIVTMCSTVFINKFISS